jgi:hypothetical protein
MISNLLQGLRVAAPLALALALLCPGEDVSAAQAVTSGEFVGLAYNTAAAPDPDPKDPPGGAAYEIVAVVVNDPGPTGGRIIRVYICDGEVGAQSDAEWFTGSIAGDSFNLTSASGDARLQGQLTETAVTGTATLADGRTLNLRAVPATAGAGLFEIFFLPDDLLTGVSASGATLHGHIVNETVQGAVTTRTVEGLITVLGGPTIAFTGLQGVFVNDTGTDPQVTTIVLPNATDFKGRGAEIKAGLKSNLAWNSNLLKELKEPKGRRRLEAVLVDEFPELDKVVVEAERTRATAPE